MTSLSSGKLTFELQSASDVAFEGTGFTADTSYTLTRSGADGSSQVLTVQSTPSGALAFTIPGAGPSTYELAGAGSSSGLFPFPLPSQATPFLFPLIAIALLWASYLVVRWTRRQSGDADRDELERNDWESDDADSNADQ